MNYRLKSELKMDKSKLIQIIEKELEELKVLTEEVTENENDTSLIIEIALSKSRLLYQEFELLRELTAKEISIQTDDLPDEDENDDEDKDEFSDVTISDPELEIVEFEEQESDKAPEADEEGIVDDFQEEEINSEVLEEEEPEADENDESDDDLKDNDIQDENEVEIEREGLIEFGENDEDEIEAEIHQTRSSIESTELKTDLQPGVREITIDLDEDDVEPVKVSEGFETTDRPVMREIPKPEELILEKPFGGESLKKENSLNDSIGETKSAESPITNGPITSLRAAIGLNDRFLFIREIFANNTDKYNTVIDKLDKLETIQQAVDYLKSNLTLQKNETSMKFVDLLKRRFSK